jgi:hypothetical protein
MRYMAAATCMAAGIVWIAIEARSPDGYYGSGDVTRWEHASNAGSLPAVLGGAVVASVIALTFLFHGVLSRRLGALAAVSAGTIYVLAWVVAWIGLMGGH